MTRILEGLRHPIVQAPMGGGPGTPALAAAVGEGGGLGVLAAGYKRAEAVREEIRAGRTATAAPFGVNLFVPWEDRADPAAVAAYVASLADDAAALGIAPGDPRFDDDGWEAKLEVVADERVPVVSFAFGCPAAEDVARLRAAGCEVWVTATEVEEAV